jgi:hypothetical protein
VNAFPYQQCHQQQRNKWSVDTCGHALQHLQPLCSAPGLDTFAVTSAADGHKGCNMPIAQQEWQQTFLKMCY